MVVEDSLSKGQSNPDESSYNVNSTSPPLDKKAGQPSLLDMYIASHRGHPLPTLLSQLQRYANTSANASPHFDATSWQQQQHAFTSDSNNDHHHHHHRSMSSNDASLITNSSFADDIKRFYSPNESQRDVNDIFSHGQSWHGPIQSQSYPQFNLAPTSIAPAYLSNDNYKDITQVNPITNQQQQQDGSGSNSNDSILPAKLSHFQLMNLMDQFENQRAPFEASLDSSNQTSNNDQNFFSNLASSSGLNGTTSSSSESMKDDNNDWSYEHPYFQFNLPWMQDIEIAQTGSSHLRIPDINKRKASEMRTPSEDPESVRGKDITLMDIIQQREKKPIPRRGSDGDLKIQAWLSTSSNSSSKKKKGKQKSKGRIEDEEYADEEEEEEEAEEQDEDEIVEDDNDESDVVRKVLIPIHSLSDSEQPRFMTRHVCPFKNCNKDFSTSGHARRHSRIHDSFRHYQCPHPHCDATFTRRDNCKQHQKNSHSEILTMIKQEKME